MTRTGWSKWALVRAAVLAAAIGMLGCGGATPAPVAPNENGATGAQGSLYPPGYPYAGGYSGGGRYSFPSDGASAPPLPPAAPAPGWEPAPPPISASVPNSPSREEPSAADDSAPAAEEPSNPVAPSTPPEANETPDSESPADPAPPEAPNDGWRRTVHWLSSHPMICEMGVQAIYWAYNHYSDQQLQTWRNEHSDWKALMAIVVQVMVNHTQKETLDALCHQPV